LARRGAQKGTPVPKKEKSRLSAGPPCRTRYRREGRLALSPGFLLLLTGLLLPAALLAGLLLSGVLVLLARILILIAHFRVLPLHR
jgi:hypothetical protein